MPKPPLARAVDKVVPTQNSVTDGGTRLASAFQRCGRGAHRPVGSRTFAKVKSAPRETLQLVVAMSLPKIIDNACRIAFGTVFVCNCHRDSQPKTSGTHSTS